MHQELNIFSYYAFQFQNYKCGKKNFINITKLYSKPNYMCLDIASRPKYLYYPLYFSTFNHLKYQIVNHH